MKDFSIHKLADSIYWAEFEDPYNMNMSFFRFQEFYESPLADVKGLNVSYLDMMEKYSKNSEKGSFTYASDWGGFNLPSSMIDKVLSNGIKDHNRYDYVILSIHSMIRSDTDKPYYLLGSARGADIGYIKHEIAHGLYYTVPKYKAAMLANLNRVDESLLDRVYQEIFTSDYAVDVLEDEAQAYLSTGDESIESFVDKAVLSPFKDTYKKYYKRKVYKDKVTIA